MVESVGHCAYASSDPSAQSLIPSHKAFIVRQRLFVVHWNKFAPQVKGVVVAVDVMRTVVVCVVVDGGRVPSSQLLPSHQHCPLKLSHRVSVLTPMQIE
jgi:hypothetical protein